MKGTRKMFGTHNSLGQPLCPACGANPRKFGSLKCGRCEREERPIQWDRLPKSDQPSFPKE